MRTACFVWILKCSGEPCSPLRVRCTRLHALRAKLNTQFSSHQKYMYKHKHSSRRAADDRPYGFTFINYYLNEKILPLPVVEPILQSVRLAFTERRYNFPLSILHFQFKKNLPNTANAIFGRIFYLFTYSLCASFSQNYSASGRLASFSR